MQQYITIPYHILYLTGQLTVNKVGRTASNLAPTITAEGHW